MAKFIKIKGDASLRSFFRKKVNGQSSIIVYAKKEKYKNLLVYDAINKILKKNKILAPKLYTQRYNKNFIEIEDFGNETILKILKKKNKNKFSYFTKIIKLLIQVQSIKDRKVKNFRNQNYTIPKYDKKILINEANLFCDWYVKNNLSKLRKKNFCQDFKKIIKKLTLKLCAGLGKRLNPITLSTPKPLLELNDKTMLEVSINLIIELGVQKILINTFHLGDQILRFIENKNFPINIQIIKEENEILNTGGGILNLINYSDDDDFIIFNPDTLWYKDYLNEIIQMQNFYFSKRLNNILLLSNKDLSFDKNLLGDFTLENNLLKKNEKNDYIYIGCQILNKSLFKEYKVSNFSISKIWKDLQKEDKLNGFQSKKKFYHLTNLDVFKKLKDL